MTNKKFAEVTTSVAFMLTLSKRQCNTLLRLAESDTPGGDGPQLLYPVQVDSLRPLDDRGLVYWARDEEGRAAGFKGLTEAGRLVAALLREAGITIESTNTTGVLRRVERGYFGGLSSYPKTEAA